MRFIILIFFFGIFISLSPIEKINKTSTDLYHPLQAYKKYDIKSGIITFTVKMEMSGFKIDSKKILYFDDYGLKECEEEYKNDETTGKEMLTKRDFVKDGFRYICTLEYNNASKSKALGYGVVSPFELAQSLKQKDKKAKKLANETICGKNCEGFSMETPSGNISMYGWNRVLLKNVLENAKMKMKSVSNATKIEENVSIPAEKFEVPKGLTITND